MWDDTRERAALMTARGRTQSEICDELGIGRVTLWEWRQCEPFQARINRHVAQFGRAADNYWIAKRLRRIEKLQAAHEALEADLAECETASERRAIRAEMRDTLKQAAQECGQWVEKQQHELAVPAIDALAELAQRRLAQDEAKARLTVEATGGEVSTGESGSTGESAPAP